MAGRRRPPDDNLARSPGADAARLAGIVGFLLDRERNRTFESWPRGLNARRLTSTNDRDIVCLIPFSRSLRHAERDRARLTSLLSGSVAIDILRHRYGTRHCPT